MRLTTSLLCLIGLIAFGCGKSTSKMFYSLEAQWESLKMNKGDKAYGDPMTAAIIAGLDGIPENAREKPKAVALAETLRTAKKRFDDARAAESVAEQEAEKRREAVRNAAANSLNQQRTEEQLPTEIVVKEIDAGIPRPVAGMSEEAFLAQFKSCVVRGADQDTPSGKASSFEVLDRYACRHLSAANMASTSWLFIDHKLWGQRTAEHFDAGTPEAPKPVTPPPAAPSEYDAGM